MTTDVAELVIRLRADTDKLQAEMRRATSTVQQSSNKMQASLGGIASAARSLLPALGVASFVGFAKNASLAADRLNDLAARTGVAATTLSALELPLRQSGSSADEFASSLTRMNNAIGEAASGQSETAARAFTDLGLSISELMAMTPEEQFNAIASALNGIQNQAEFTNKGMAIFGRQFASIAPVIKEVNGDLDTFIKRQQELGNAFTASELQMVNDFWDAYEGKIKQAEVATIRFINLIANLRSNIAKELDFEWVQTESGTIKMTSSSAAAYKGARERGMSDAQAKQMLGRISQEKPNTVDQATFSNAKLNRVTVAPTATAQTKVMKEQQDAAVKDYENNLKKQAEAAKKASDATEELTNSLKDRLSQGLTQAIFSADSAGDAFKNMAMQIAQSIFEKSVAQPLSNGIVDAIGSAFGGGGGIFSSLSSFLPSFDVGSANVPRDMIAQIHKGERIIPANQNNPNGIAALSGGGSGQSVTVNQYFQTGVSRAELQGVLPQVAMAAHDAVFATIQKGGSAAKIVGAR